MAEESETFNVEGEEVNEEIVDDEQAEQPDEAAAAAAEEGAAAAEAAAAEEEAAAAAAEEEAARVAAAEEEAAAAAEEAARVQAEQEAAAAAEEEESVEQAEQSEESSGLTDDLKQRIAELDYLRECCGNWVGSGRAGKRNFLTAWESKSVSVDSNVNYEDSLDQLEKLPEIVKLWAERKVTTDSNHFKNIQSYTLEKSLYNEKSVTEKVEVLEQLIDLLTDCANGKMRVTQIEEVIDNLY